MDHVKVVSLPPSVPWTQIAMNRFAISTLLVVCLSLVGPSHSAKPPHILLIVADDLGWRDVGFHGSLIKTPNLDQLSGDGLTLDNYYVQPICTPTRSALMTGKYPIHTGLQHLVVFPTQPYGLSPNETILPQRLKQAGYQTHMVGKWHLGYFADEYLPTRRGFDSFFGFYNGWEDHLTHKVAGITDFRDGDEIAKDYEGAYSTVVFAKRAEQIISQHDPSKPLFLYMAFQNVHLPVQAPEAYIQKYSFIQGETRRTHAAMVDIMDEAVGNLTRAFKTAGLWDDTLTVFSTDNGGLHTGGGYNWPLRGEKTYLWEGGVRGVSFVHGQMLQTKGKTARGLMHVTDWYPTLLHAAGLSAEGGLDGVDLWESIVQGTPSPREEILLNIDVIGGGDRTEKKSKYEGMALRMGDMKLLVDVPDCGWLKPPEMNADDGGLERAPSEGKNIALALYNITADPTERVDLSEKLPDVVKRMQQRLEEIRKSEVPPRNKPADPRARVKALRTGAWGPWL